MCTNSICRSTPHAKKCRLVSSGPLSQRITFGCPRSATIASSTRVTLRLAKLVSSSKAKPVCTRPSRSTPGSRARMLPHYAQNPVPTQGGDHLRFRVPVPGHVYSPFFRSNRTQLCGERGDQVTQMRRLSSALGDKATCYVRSHFVWVGLHLVHCETPFRVLWRLTLGIPRWTP